MVAGKLDPTIGQLCFRRNFQTVGNLQKGTTGMNSEGPKMVEMSYGLAGNGRKIKRNPITHGGRRRRFAGPIPGRPTAVGRENLPEGSSGCPPPPCPARVAGGRLVVPPLVQTITACKWLNCPTWCSRFWRVFPRVWSSRWCFGARVSFGIQSYVYIGPRVSFR